MCIIYDCVTQLSWQGDTLDNIEQDLRCLLHTGCFEIIIPETMNVAPSCVSTAPMLWNEGDQRRLLLHYRPSAPVQSEAVDSATALTKPVTWNREQIEDFTRKLGFLEKGSADRSHFKFQQLSAVRLQGITMCLNYCY